MKMKVIIIFCLLSIALAEPPVNDNYGPPKPSYINDRDLSYGPQRGLSQEYGAPHPSSRIHNAPSKEYGLPAAKSALKLSSSYGLPLAEVSQQYGVPNTRASNSESLYRESIDSGEQQPLGYPSDTYGAPNLRSGPYQESTSPQVTQSYTKSHLPSSQYGAPGYHSPSEQYGHPTQGLTQSRVFQKPSLRNRFQAKQGLSQEYGLPSIKSNDISQSYTAPKADVKSYSSRGPPQNYGSPKTNSVQQKASLSTSYGVPDSIVTSDYSQDVKSGSPTYGVQSRKDLPEMYGAPSARRSFEQYKNIKQIGFNTNAIATSYNFGRSSPATNYGTPSAGSSMPSEYYGAPEQYAALTDEGYGYAGNNLDDQDQEPASYDFGYKVNDYITGSDFGHTESRQDNRAEGTYFVVLPDGNKQVVEYEADERGFKPRISVEPAEESTSGGYDDNAADLTKTEHGSY